MSSCRKTVFIDSSYTSGYLSVTISMSKSGGSLASIPPASSFTISCGHRQTLSERALHRTANHEWLMISSHLWWFGSAASLSRQSQQHSVQQLIGLLVVFGDVSVAVEAEDLRFSSDGKVADVVHVNLHTKEIMHLFWFECTCGWDMQLHQRARFSVNNNDNSVCFVHN